MEHLWAPWRMEYIEKAKDGKAQPCIFCIRPGEQDDRKNLILHRGERGFVIMNRFPYNNGHLMVVPYRHSGELADLDAGEHGELFYLLRLCQAALQRVMAPHGYNIGMNLGRVSGAGIDDHLHFHIVPRWNGDTNFMPVISGTKVVSEALEATFDKLKEAIHQILQEEK